MAVESEQGSLFRCLALHADGGFEHVPVYLIANALGRGAVCGLGPEDRSAHELVAACLGAPVAELFALVDEGPAGGCEQYRTCKANLWHIVAERRGGAVFVMVGQFRRGYCVAAHTLVLVPAVAERTGQRLRVAGGVYCFAVQALSEVPPELELEQRRQTGIEGGAGAVV